jgi:hypothetical protein
LHFFQAFQSQTLSLLPALPSETIGLIQNFSVLLATLSYRLSRDEIGLVHEIRLQGSPDSNREVKHQEPVHASPERGQAIRDGLRWGIGGLSACFGFWLGYFARRWFYRRQFVRFGIAWTVAIGSIVFGISLL